MTGVSRHLEVSSETFMLDVRVAEVKQTASTRTSFVYDKVHWRFNKRLVNIIVPYHISFLSTVSYIFA